MHKDSYVVTYEDINRQLNIDIPRNKPVKAGFIGANGKQHAGNGTIAIIGKELQLLRDGDVE